MNGVRLACVIVSTVACQRRNSLNLAVNTVAYSAISVILRVSQNICSTTSHENMVSNNIILKFNIDSSDDVPAWKAIVISRTRWQFRFGRHSKARFFEHATPCHLYCAGIWRRNKLHLSRTICDDDVTWLHTRHDDVDDLRCAPTWNYLPIYTNTSIEHRTANRRNSHRTKKKTKWIIMWRHV